MHNRSARASSDACCDDVAAIVGRLCRRTVRCLKSLFQDVRPNCADIAAFVMELQLGPRSAAAAVPAVLMPRCSVQQNDGDNLLRRSYKCHRSQQGSSILAQPASKSMHTSCTRRTIILQRRDIATPQEVIVSLFHLVGEGMSYKSVIHSCNARQLS